MFRIFKKRQQQPAGGDKFSDKAAKLINKPIVKLQTRFANSMSKYERRLSVRQKKIALFIFCFFMCSCSALFLYKGLYTADNSTPVWLKHEPITIPENTKLPDSLNLDLLQLLKEKYLLDSLRADSIHQKNK